MPTYLRQSTTGMYFDDAERETYDQILEQSDNGVYDDVPQFIVEDLLFPYSGRVRFCILLSGKDGGLGCCQ